MDQKSTENWEELGGRLWKLSGCKGIGTTCALIDATTRGRSTEPPDDVDACAWWEVRPTTSLKSPGGEVARDVVGLGQVVTRAQGDEVRKCRGAALGVGVVVVTVGGRVSAASTENVHVFALVASAGEPFDALSRREVALGVLLWTGVSGRTSDENSDTDCAEDDDDDGRSHCGFNFGGVAMLSSKRALACAISMSLVMTSASRAKESDARRRRRR